MPLKWQSKPKYDGELADERSLAGEERPFTLTQQTSLSRMKRSHISGPKLLAALRRHADRFTILEINSSTRDRNRLTIGAVLLGL